MKDSKCVTLGALMQEEIEAPRREACLRFEILVLLRLYSVQD